MKLYRHVLTGILLSIALFAGEATVSAGTVNVGTSGTVVRGGTATINWNVVGFSQCNGRFPNRIYPVSGDNINNYWTTTAFTGTNSTSTPFYGDVAGFTTSPGVSQTFTFRCVGFGDPTTYGEADLIVTDCSPGDMWNGSNACVPAGPPVIGTSFIATPNPVAYNTSTVLSWAFTGTVTSCTLSGGQYGAGISVLANDNRTTNNLTVATT